jgi:hypothetical protein
MKVYGGVDVSTKVFFTSALVGGEWSAFRSGFFIPGEISPDTHRLGGWVDPRAGLDDMEKWKILRPTGTRTPTSVCSQSLYWLHYPGSQ